MCAFNRRGYLGMGIKIKIIQKKILNVELIMQCVMDDSVVLSFSKMSGLCFCVKLDSLTTFHSVFVFSVKSVAI